jgi:hypothetical protein
MSETIQGAIEALEYYAAQLLRDFEAIPPADRTRTFPQAGASAAQIVKQCAVVTRRQAAYVRGEEPRVPFEPAPSAEDAEQAKREFEAAVEELRATLEAVTPESLAQERQMPWGATMALRQYIFRPSNHLAYHDGQLGYIQLLLGDREFHSR